MKMKSNQELKPCPFCGYEAQIIYHTSDKWITCVNDCCEGMTCRIIAGEDDEAIIRKWNTRAESTDAEKLKNDLIKELQSELEKCRWIPVSERLPERDDIYEATYLGVFDEKNQTFVSCLLYKSEYKIWYTYSKEHGGAGGVFIGLANKIIAWKEKFSPYQPPKMG
jgi:hypothetical protein